MVEDIEYEEELEEEEIEEDQEPKNNKQEEKPLDNFELCIKEYLDNFSEQDQCFKEKYDNSKIRDCVQYIYSEVKKSGRNGFCDDEIYQMARHYFLEEIKGVKGNPPSKVIVNHTIELSDEEKNKAKEKALKEYEKEQLENLKKQQKKKEEKEQKIVAKEKVKAQEKGYEQINLLQDWGE